MEDNAILAGIAALLCMLVAIHIGRDMTHYLARRRRCKPYGGAAAALAGADAYVINLDQHPDRLNSFAGQWRASDLATTADGGRKSFIRWRATDADQIDWRTFLSPRALEEANQLEQTGYRKRHYQLSRGAVGCTLSHWRLWEAAYATPAPVVFCFEDDALIPRNTRAVLDCMSPPPADWDVLLLGRFCARCSPTPAGGTSWLRVKRFFGTHAYVVNRKGLRTLLANKNKLFPISHQIDSAMSLLSAPRGPLNIYATSVDLVQQSTAFATSIQKPLRNSSEKDAWALPAF